jgi:predicted TIM-barrel enzyme
MTVAHAAGLDFIRAGGFAFAHVADEGILESSAAALLRYRRTIGAERVQVWADVKKKHSSHAITADVGIGEAAHAVDFMRGDAVIVSGSATVDAPQRADLVEVKRKARLPVHLGSGVTEKTRDNFSRWRTDSSWVRTSKPAGIGRGRWMRNAWRISWQPTPDFPRTRAALQAMK